MTNLQVVLEKDQDKQKRKLGASLVDYCEQYSEICIFDAGFGGGGYL